MMRLRYLLSTAPSQREAKDMPQDTEVTFAPMEMISDGVGGLDASITKPLKELQSGSYNYFREGDLLLAKVTPCFENGKKAVASGLANGIGFATSEVHVLRPHLNKLDSQFLLYLLSSENFRSEGVRSMTGAGGLRRVSASAVLNFRTSITDLSTQKRIAYFLDKETALIDALIEKNERLISLCEEKRRSVIDDVFSQSNRFTAIKHVADINYDTLSSGCPDDLEIRYADLSRVCPLNGIDPEVMAFKDAPSRARRIVHEGDVLFASVGPFSKKVLSAKAKDEGTIVSTGFFVLKAKRGHYSAFLEKILQSTHVLSEVEKGAVGAIYAAVNDSTFKNIKIPVFSYDEQVRLSQLMERQISNLNSLSDKAKRMNALLKEKRSALITAAVTGQIEIPAE